MMKTATLVAMIAGAGMQTVMAEEVPLQPVSIYKSSDCDISQDWLDTLRGLGIDVGVDIVENVPEIQRNFGVPDPAGCFVGIAGDYFLNGEVPAEIVVDLLQQFPAIRGVSAVGDTVTTHD